MTAGDIRAAVIVARALREDWQQQQTEAAVIEVAADYSHEDVLYTIAVVARDKNNRAPMMIGVKIAEISAGLHPKNGAVTHSSKGHQNKAFLCFVCSRPRSVCENSAANQGADRHDFVANRDAEARLQTASQRPKSTQLDLPEDA